MERREALVRLNLTERVGALTFQRLLERFGSPAAVFSAPPPELARLPGIGPVLAGKIRAAGRDERGPRELERAARAGIRVLTIDDPDYPALLREVYNPPLVLYVRGELKPEDSLAIGIVGSRRCTRYGREQAERFGRELAQRGITIVSGLARGVDGASHRGALAGNGRTIAVLGSGLNRIYPPEHRELADRIAETGAVVSEFPLDAQPERYHFPQRNRVISGLARGLLVIEAARDSGSLITVRFALEQGREVFALPGRVDSKNSRGTHRIIRDGAKLVEEIADLIEELGEDFRRVAGLASPGQRQVRLSEAERQVFAVLDETERDIDAVVEALDLPLPVILGALLTLEMKQLVNQYPGKVFARARGVECLAPADPD